LKSKRLDLGMLFSKYVLFLFLQQGKRETDGESQHVSNRITHKPSSYGNSSKSYFCDWCINYTLVSVLSTFSAALRRSIRRRRVKSSFSRTQFLFWIKFSVALIPVPCTLRHIGQAGTQKKPSPYHYYFLRRVLNAPELFQYIRKKR
jgi:hypothetical protein